MDAGVDVERLGRGVRLRHALHVAAGAERAARARQQYRTDIGCGFAFGERAGERFEHRAGQRVATLGAVHRDGRNAVFDVGEEVGGVGGDGAVGHVWGLVCAVAFL